MVDSEDSYARAMLEATRHPLLAIDDALTVRAANAAFFALCCREPSDVEGRPLAEVGIPADAVPALRRLVEAVLSGRDPVHDYRIGYAAEAADERVLLANATRIDRGDSDPHVLVGLADVPDADTAATVLRQEKEYAENIVDTIHEGVLVLHPDLTVESANRPFYRTFDVMPEDTIGVRLFDLGNGQWDIPNLRAALERILGQATEVVDWEVDHTFEHIGRRVFTVTARKLENQDRLLAVLRDITEAKEASRREDALRRELQHRLKNMLAIIQAIANQTARTATTAEAFHAALNGRLAGMERSLEFTRTGPEGVSIPDIIRRELHAHGADEGRHYGLSGAFGPVPGDLAQVIGLAVHELATNAVKYGALKAPDGFIQVGIDDPPQGRKLTIRWRETGVAIAAAPPHRGFGFQLIEGLLDHEAGGGAAIAFHPDGLECTLSIARPKGRPVA